MQGPTNNEYSFNVYDPNAVMQPVMQQPPQTVAPPPKTAKKTGSKALTIINPATGKSIFDDDTTSSVNSDAGEKTNADHSHHKEDSMEKENAEPLTPVVSAMSDGPSVDITPKHTSKNKKTKPPEIILADPPKAVIKIEQKVVEVEPEIVAIQVPCSPDTENNNGGLVSAVPIVEMTEIPQIKSVTPPPTPVVVVAVEIPQVVEFIPQPAVVIDSNDTNNNNYQKVADEVEEIPEELLTPEADETDRAAVVEIPQDSNNNSTEADEKLADGLIAYDDDQWSPANLAGKKYYTRDQLLKLKDAIGVPPLKLPEGVANTLMKNNKEYLTNTLNQTMPPPMGMRQPYDAINSVAPKFMMNQPGGRNPYPNKRPSQTGIKQQVPGRGSQSGPDRQIIKLNLSLQDNVKLNEAENAWKPTHLSRKPDLNEEERQTSDVLSKFRSMLNKLTAENFDVLVNDVRTYKIDTTERLDGVSFESCAFSSFLMIPFLGYKSPLREGNFRAKVCTDLCKFV